MGGLLAAAAALVLAVQMQPARWPRLTGSADPRFAKLVAAVGEERYIEGRLTGGFKYGPLRSVTRGPGDFSNQNLSLLAAAGELQKAAQEDPSAENLHAWGVAQLLLGEYDGAVSALEQSIELAPHVAGYHADLSAAYLARSSRLDRPEDVPRSLAAAERALALEPEMHMALFNRAAAISTLNLGQEARRAWTAYLEQDPSSAWAGEARARLAALAGQEQGSRWEDDQDRALGLAARRQTDALESLVSQYPQQFRELIEDQLLPRWGVQQQAGGGGAAETLDQAEAIAVALVRRTGDHLTADAVAHLQALRRPTNLADAAMGLAGFGEARRAYEATRVSESMELFLRSRRFLASVGSPMALWCDHHLGIGPYYEGRYQDVRMQQALLINDGTARYPILRARARWMLGLTDNLSGRFTEQIGEFSAALTAFELAGERENAAAVHSLLSNAYLYIGDVRPTWRHTLKALSALGPQTPPRRRHTQLTSAVNKAIRAGWPEVALVFAAEALDPATGWDRAEARLESHHFRARALVALDRYSDAQEALEAAGAQLEAVVDPLIRRRLEAELAQSEADVWLTAEPGRAVAAADRALSYFEGRQAFLRVPRLALVKGRALAQSLDLDAARRSFEHGLMRFERERGTVPVEEDLRLSHFDEAWTAYHALASLLNGMPAAAADVFGVIERSKARSLSEALPGGKALSSISQLRSALDAETTLLYFAVLRDQTLVWAISRGASVSHRIDVTERELAQHARALTRSLTGPSEDAWRTEAGWWFETLVRPVWSGIPPGQRLVISPDGPIHGVPFPMLWDQVRGRFVIEDMSVVQVPSGGFLLRGLERAPRALRRVAAAGVGWGVPDLQLDPLPFADAEAAKVVSLMNAGVALTGNNATLSRLGAELAGADVVHFSGHAVANAEFPALSRMFLSDGASGVAAVSPAELRALNLHGVELVVLSACDTLGGPLHRGEGIVSLARTFLAAGVPAVVAAYWRVEDGAATEMMTGFYDHLRSGLSESESLARAQRAAIGRGHPPVRWAPWVLTGLRPSMNPRDQGDTR